MRGRKPLTELESLRRKALRTTLAIKSLKDDLKEFGDDMPNIMAMDTPGRRPLSRKQVIKRDQSHLEIILARIAEIEAETGAVPLPIRKVYDPFIHSTAANKIGRKENSEIDWVDRQLQIECEKVPGTFADLKKNKGYDIWEAEVTISEKGKRMGRLPKPFSQRFAEHKNEITRLLADMETLELNMTAVEKFDRQLTLYRDYERIKKKRTRQGISTTKYADYSAEINEILATKKEIEPSQYSESIELFHPFEREVMGILRDIEAVKIKVRAKKALVVC